MNAAISGFREDLLDKMKERKFWDLVGGVRRDGGAVGSCIMYGVVEGYKRWGVRDPE